MTERVHDHDALIYTVGTQVVVSRDVLGGGGRVLHPGGSVAVVLRAPRDLDHTYRVRFPDGSEESLRRDEVVMLARFKEGTLYPAGGETGGDETGGLFGRVFYRCVIGSRAYGLDDDQSDVDYRGIYLPRADRQWSLGGVPGQLERHETQEQYWEIQRFVVLALKANPNVLECLYTPLVEKATPLAEELLAMRDAFLSRMVYQTYNGYVLSQFRKMRSDLKNQGQAKPKHVMHLIRLLISGIGVLRDGAVTVRVERHRDELLAIKRGEMPPDEAERWRLSLHAEFDRAHAESRLPDRPDYARADAFLVKARRLALADELP